VKIVLEVFTNWLIRKYYENRPRYSWSFASKIINRILSQFQKFQKNEINFEPISEIIHFCANFPNLKKKEINFEPISRDYPFLCQFQKLQKKEIKIIYNFTLFYSIESIHFENIKFSQLFQKCSKNDNSEDFQGTATPIVWQFSTIFFLLYNFLLSIISAKTAIFGTNFFRKFNVFFTISARPYFY